MTMLTPDHPNARALAEPYAAIAALENDPTLSHEEKKEKSRAIQGALAGRLSPDFRIHTGGARLAASGGLDLLVAMAARRDALSNGTFRVAEVHEVVADDHYGFVRCTIKAERGDRTLDIEASGVWRFVDGKAAEHWETPPHAEWDDFFLSGDPGFSGTGEEFWRKGV